MTETTAIAQQRDGLPAKLGAIASGGRIGAIVPETMDDAYRLAKAIASSGIAPRGYTKGKGDSKEPDPNAIMVGIVHGLEVGLTPMAALQSIAVINGMPTIWGDGAIALVYASGEVEDIEEVFEGKPYDDDFAAVCRIWRKGRKRPTEIRFSVDDAKRAGLWQESATKRAKVWKDGAQVWSNEAPNDAPWYRYPKRMLQMRARSWALRDSCADVLRGLSIREEVEDMVRAEDEGPMTPAAARHAALAAAPPPPEDAPPEAPTTVASELPAAVAAPAEEEPYDAVIDEEPPEDAPPAPVEPVEIDDVTFARNIEGEFRKLAIGDEGLFEAFERIASVAEDRMAYMLPPEAAALSDMVERYRKELDL